MKRIVILAAVLCLLLTGCNSLLEGSYQSITPHQEKPVNSGSQTVAVSSYSALYRALVNMVHSGTVAGVISIENYNQLVVARDTRYAIENLLLSDPIGAFAVEDIQFQLGTNAGQSAIAVSISYYHDRTELQKIQHLENMAQAEAAIGTALNNCDSGIVLYIGKFQEYDFVQWAEDYADENPHMVMEKPQVSVNLYPETGTARVLELKFTYRNSREKLRSMQTQVGTKIGQILREAAAAEGQQEAYRKLFQLLTEEVTGLETSITPAYSLLLHGVGDSKALATMYSAVARQQELSCITVTGSRQGEPRYWNIIRIDGAYFHVDLLRSAQEGSLRLMTDSEMAGYVWDYSNYPACKG